MDTSSQPSQGSSAVRTGLYQCQFALSFYWFSLPSHCFIACSLSCSVPFLPVPWHGREMPCTHHPLSHLWYSAQLLSRFEFTDKDLHSKSFIFSPTKYSCDMYLVQPNELPDKAHSSASVFSPKETTLHYVHGRTLILLSRGNLKKDNDPNKQPDFCGAESKKCIRKQPFFPPRKRFISAGPTKPHKGKLSSRLINS